jgi:transposase-like protein
VTKDDVLFGYRLQLFDLAGRTSVSHACRTFGVHRSTYYAWKRQVDRHGLEMLRPRESYAWAELVVCKHGNPTAAQTSNLARRVAGDLRAAGWRLERVICDNGNEFRGEAFAATIKRLGARKTHIHAGRPQTNGHVEALHKTILDECWRPVFARYLYPALTALRRDLDTYLRYYNTDRVHHGRLTRGRIPADIVYGARKMEAR